MINVNVTELRKRLPEYLQKVKSGEELAVTSRGKVIARVVPEVDEAVAARERLEVMRQQSWVGDVVTPLNEEWEVLHAAP